MDDHGGAFVHDRRCLDKEPTGMEERENDEHDVVKMELEEDVSVQAIEEGLAMGKDGSFGLTGCP